MVNDPDNIAFSERLNELLDARKFAEKGRGRQVELAKKYDLVQQSIGKWLKGEGMPKTTQMIRIARDFKCNFEWLALGTGPRDAECTAPSPHAEIIRRLEMSPPETTTLIELALLEAEELERSPLSPSLKGLVTFLKKQIQEETRHHPREANDPAEAKRITDLLERS